MPPPIIAVLGATGSQGGGVVAALQISACMLLYTMLAKLCCDIQLGIIPRPS